MYLLLKLFIIKRIKKAMFKKLLKSKFASVGSTVALIVGILSQLLGIDIAPDYVSAVVTVVSGSIALWHQWQAKHPDAI